jgi:hypothetical protein
MNKPIPMSKVRLLVLLDDIRVRIAADDSYEGSLEYGMPLDESGEIIPDADFVVRAAYRVGNLQGQGGMRLIGRIEDGPDLSDQATDDLLERKRTDT